LNERIDVRIPAFDAPHEHADAPHAPALLRAHSKRPSRRAAEPGDELAPSKANAHLALLCWQKIARPSLYVLRSRMPRSGCGSKSPSTKPVML
jgi:hypothetical protein